MIKLRFNMLEKVSGILVNMLLFPPGLFALTIFLPPEVLARIQSFTLNANTQSTTLGSAIILFLAFAVGIPLRKLHDRLEQTAKAHLSSELVIFRSLVIAIYSAILIWGLMAMSGGKVLGYLLSVITVILLLALITGERFMAKRAQK